MQNEGLGTYEVFQLFSIQAFFAGHDAQYSILM